MRPFDSIGQRFDPTLHEAVATVRGVGGAPGTMVGVALVIVGEGLLLVSGQK